MATPNTNILQRWVVQLQYQISDEQERRFRDAMQGATLRARLLGDAIEQMAVRSVLAFDRVVNSYNELYFAADRTKSTVESLTAVSFATRMLGGTAEGAMQNFENLGRKLRQFGTGYETLFKQMHVQTRNAKGELRDTVDIVMDYVDNLKKLYGNDYIRIRPYLEAVGLTDERAQLAAFNGKFRELVDENRRLQERLFGGKEGVKRVASDANEFAQSMFRVGMIWDNIIKLFMSKMIAGGKGPLADFVKWMEKPENVDKMAEALTNVANAIIAIAKALAQLATSDTFQSLINSITTFITKYAETGSLWQAGKAAWKAGMGVPPDQDVGIRSWNPAWGPDPKNPKKEDNETAIDVGKGLKGLGSWLKGLFISEAHAGELGEGGVPDFIKAFVAGVDNATRALGIFTKLITKWLLDKMGINVPGISKIGGDGGGGDGGGGSGNGWRGGIRRGHHVGGGGATGDVPGTGSFKALVDREAAAAGIDPRIMYGILAGESAGASHRFVVNPNDPSGGAFGPWQMVGGGRLGSQFQKDTGLDWRKPENIPAMTRYAARKIAWMVKHGVPIHGIWHGYHGNRDWGKGWGDFGYKPDTGSKGESHEPPGDGKTAPPAIKPDAGDGKTAPPAIKPDAGGVMHYKNPPLRPSSPPMSLQGGPLLGNYASIDRSLTMNPTTNITVHGVQEPGRAADMIAANMQQVNQNLTREASSVIS